MNIENPPKEIEQKKSLKDLLIYLEQRSKELNQEEEEFRKEALKSRLVEIKN